MFRKLSVILFLSLLSLVMAQPANANDSAASKPSFSVSPLQLSSGDIVFIRGSGLRPNNPYQIALIDPSGNTRLRVARADSGGNLDFEAPLETEGEWQLVVRSGNFREAFSVRVQPQAALEAPEPAESPEVVTAALARSFSIEDNALVARRGTQIDWQLEFTAASGPFGNFLETAEGLYLAHGNSVLLIDPASGVVQQRWLVSGPVSQLVTGDNGSIVITVSHQDGLKESFTLQDQQLLSTVRFGTDPAIFSWLKEEAAVDDPAARLRQDPTNPWLYLAVGLEALNNNSAEARALLTQAIETANSFYDLAGISRSLLAAEQNDLAAQAFDAAIWDFSSRGYDPRLLLGAELHEAYNFPLQPLQQAIQARNLDDAEFWAERLFLASPNVEGAAQTLDSYVMLLRDEDRRDQAALWRERSRGSRRVTVAGSLERLMTTLGSSGWLAALALLIAVLALHLTLLFKYWIPQTEVLKKQRAEKGRTNPLARLFAIRYYSFTEKLVLVLLFVAIFTLVALANWNDQGSELVPAVQSGTLANAQASSYLASGELSGSRAAFIRGYAAQIAGDSNAARQYYQEADGYAPAFNNLGVLESNEAMYQRALELSPGLAEANYNLGRQSSGFPFEQRYLPGQPVLVVPNRQDFQAALAGNWDQALQRSFSNPWLDLNSARPFNMAGWLWLSIYILFLLSAAITILWLLIPRPRSARNAPRTFLYHLLALLIPGSGLADEAWGLLLIVPWALIGFDTLAELFGWVYDIGLGLQGDYIALGILYAINLVAFIVEFVSYSRRMNQRHKQAQGISQKETARA